MSPLACIAGFAILTAPQSGEKTITDPELGLSFTHPKSWQVSRDRSKAWKITMPLEGGVKASLEIFAVSFREPADRWQEYQALANQNLKRTVDRQWQEEILGVPMLLTRIYYSQKDVPMATLVGLLYGAVPKKMNFRLTAPSAGFEQAEQEWRTALQSLRTISGKLPDAEDPSKPPPDPVLQPATPKNQAVLKPPTQEKPTRKVRGRAKLPARAAGRDVVFTYPGGWTATPDGDGFVLTRGGFKGRLRLEVLGTLDSPPPARALSALSGNSLGEFSKVTLRDETRPSYNKAGAMVTWVRREGLNVDQPLIIQQAVGDCGDYYWLIDYRSDDPRSARRERGAIQDLLDIAFVELAP
ncbi:MAG TPA: hypothetical protein PLH94_07310 [Fimbriimonadaceae bacterium]|nr:hypothetical protein [Fimbriimonadaceae bacterium]